MRRICNKTGRNDTRQDTICKDPPYPHTRADRPNNVWETDTTYGRGGPVDVWCHCFDISDIYARQRIACRFGTPHTADAATDSPAEAVIMAKPGRPGPTPRCDSAPPPGMQAKSSERPHHHQACVPDSSIPARHRAERPHGIVPQRPHTRMHLAARPCQLSGCREGNTRDLLRLQQCRAALWDMAHKMGF